ncbi:MAG: hypothetical protein LBE92_10590 [Chryseobacterium sp.]|jgi:hypothetical protein|uniref:hypothetical protein n=1 Tax=Chryseobacterium sp. TaxID=1871047 RepID=UPI0028361D11|nr:hypothetical protein [Chryseobacterium sp.]MDR2236563.1 hypothetical protein [Chryseobacterium sp.]
MRKFLSLLSIVSVSLAYAQTGPLIIRNLTTNYDYRGTIFANNFAGAGCNPVVASIDPSMIRVPAGTTVQYNNYRDQYVPGSPSSVLTWSVLLATGGTPTLRPWNHPSLMPGGVISNNTQWSMSKFQMFHAGTLNPETYFYGNIGDAANPCVGNTDYIDAAPMGTASWFTITTGGTVYTYLVLN